MAMKTAESDKQKQLRKSHEDAKIAAQDSLAQTTVAPPATASEDGLKLLVQARLSVSSPSDSFEHEAESMADEFVKSIHGRTVAAPTTSVGSVARSVPDSGLVEGSGGLATTDDTASAIMSARAGGQALSGDVRSRFEGFFGADLGGVKIHNDGTSDNLCRSINAEAFTTGNDVFFSSRSFKPGSSSGDHLLAHELTHVVQQGNAPTLSRRAMPDIQRSWWNPFADKKTQKVADAGEIVGLGKGGTGIHGAVEGKSVDADGKHVPPDMQPQAVKDSAITGGALGLVTSVSALFTTIVRLVTEWDNETTGSARDQLIASVKSALSICQNSTSIAVTAGAAVASGAIPGIGLAYSTIDLGKQIIAVHETNKAAAITEGQIDQLKKAEATSPSLENKKLLVSLTNLAASARSEYIRSIFRLTSDLISMGGQITLLATAPTGAGAVVGAALIAAGAIGHGLVALQSKISQWSSASALAASRDELNRAQLELDMHKAAMGGEPTEEQMRKSEELGKRVDDLAVENLGIDAYAAAAQLIKYSAGLVKPDGELDAEATSLVSQFNISASWLQNYVKGGSTPEMLDKGAKLICEFVGKSPDAKGLVDDLKGAASFVASKIQWLASGGYWVLKFASKIVLSVAITPVALLVGLFGKLTGNPELGYQFIEEYDRTVTKAGNDIEGAVKKKFKDEQHPYFESKRDIEQRTATEVQMPLSDYFISKKDRGTDAKPGTVTDLLKAPYKKLFAMANAARIDGSKPFAGSAEQMSYVDNMVTTIIQSHVARLFPTRISKDSIKVVMGKVDFKYIGREKAQTKGWFAGLRGREDASKHPHPETTIDDLL